MNFIKKNFALVIAFALPVILIVTVALVAYIPSSFVSTNYNFVYSACSDGTDYYPYGCENYLRERYTVSDNRLILNDVDPVSGNTIPVQPDVKESYTSRVFLHDTTANESREITLEEAQELKLSSLLTSPDGITVSSHYNRGGGFLFFNSGSSYGQYLTKGNDRSKLNLVYQDDSYYRNNFYFIGWVLSN